MGSCYRGANQIYRKSASNVYTVPPPPSCCFRVNNLFAQTQEAESMIEKMEQDEDVLIERLKKVQDDQRKAYEMLQESLES